MQLLCPRQGGSVVLGKAPVFQPHGPRFLSRLPIYYLGWRKPQLSEAVFPPLSNGNIVPAWQNFLEN